MAVRRVFIRNLVLLARIGVHAHEEAGPQRVRVNIVLETEDQRGGPDTLSAAVDYEALAVRLRLLVGQQHVRLVETLADRVADSCLEDRRVYKVSVRIEKLDVFHDAESAGVEIERQR